jgi:hypothetical protein
MCDSICLLLGHCREMEQSGPGPVNCGRRRRDARHPRTRGTATAMEASSKSAWSSLGRAVYLLLTRESTSDRKQAFGEAMGRRGWFRSRLLPSETTTFLHAERASSARGVVPGDASTLCGVEDTVTCVARLLLSD